MSFPNAQNALVANSCHLKKIPAPPDASDGTFRVERGAKATIHGSRRPPWAVVFLRRRPVGDFGAGAFGIEELTLRRSPGAVAFRDLEGVEGGPRYLALSEATALDEESIGIGNQELFGVLPDFETFDKLVPFRLQFVHETG